MANQNTYNVYKDGALPPCLWELAFSFRSDAPEVAASKLCAYLTAHGATDKEIEGALAVIRSRGVLCLPEGQQVAPDRAFMSLCAASEDCREICSLILGSGGESAYCSICPVSKRLGGIYVNENEANEASLLAMMYLFASRDEAREIIELGERKELPHLFSSSLQVKTYERRRVYPVPYILAYALYLMCKSRVYVSTDSTDSMCDSIASILASREIPMVGTIEDINRLFLDEDVRLYVERLCQRVRYSEVDYSSAFRALDYCGCKAYNERRASILGEEMTERMIRFLGDEDFLDEPEPASQGAEGVSSSPAASDEPVASTEPVEIDDFFDVPASSDDMAQSPASESEETPDAEAVVVSAITDDNISASSSTATLANVKTATRSVSVETYDNGVYVVPLSSTGDPVDGCVVGSDGLINPYVSLGDSIKRPSGVPGLTPFTLAVSIESTPFYTVEYAICEQEEGFLAYIYQRRCTIFVGRSDWDYYNVILATFRRSVPKKLTMLAAPLIDYITRMGETLHRGIIPVYDAYRLKSGCSETDEVRIMDLLLPGTADLADAMRQYSVIWKRTGLEAKDLEDAVHIAALFSSSVYAYAFTGTRYPHLYHNGITYQLGWVACRLRVNYVKINYHLDFEKTSSVERGRCYKAMLLRLGNGSAYLSHGLHLASCDADKGLSVVVPFSAYPWTHNFLFLRLGEVAKKLLGKNVNVTEDCVCSISKAGPAVNAETHSAQSDEVSPDVASDNVKDPISAEEAMLKANEEVETDDAADKTVASPDEPKPVPAKKKSSSATKRKEDLFDDFDA